MAETPKDFSDMLPNVDRISGRAAQYWVDYGIIFGAAALVTLCVVIWAVAFRNRGRKKKPIPIMGSDGRPRVKGSDTEHRRGRSRGERFVHRNPTLAETGGLPPLRPEGSEPPASPQSHLPS